MNWLVNTESVANDGQVANRGRYPALNRWLPRLRIAFRGVYSLDRFESRGNTQFRENRGHVMLDSSWREKQRFGDLEVTLPLT